MALEFIHGWNLFYGGLGHELKKMVIACVLANLNVKPIVRLRRSWPSCYLSHWDSTITRIEPVATTSSMVIPFGYSISVIEFGLVQSSTSIIPCFRRRSFGRPSCGRILYHSKGGLSTHILWLQVLSS